eukprot:1720450-Rhodomonas_salina.1
MQTKPTTGSTGSDVEHANQTAGSDPTRKQDAHRRYAPSARPHLLRTHPPRRLPLAALLRPRGPFPAVRGESCGVSVFSGLDPTLSACSLTLSSRRDPAKLHCPLLGQIKSFNDLSQSRSRCLTLMKLRVRSRPRGGNCDTRHWAQARRLEVVSLSECPRISDKGCAPSLSKTIMTTAMTKTVTMTRTVTRTKTKTLTMAEPMPPERQQRQELFGQSDRKDRRCASVSKTPKSM